MEYHELASKLDKDGDGEISVEELQVGLVEQVRSSRQVVQDFREEFIDAVSGLMAAMDTQ